MSEAKYTVCEGCGGRGRVILRHGCPWIVGVGNVGEGDVDYYSDDCRECDGSGRTVNQKGLPTRKRIRKDIRWPQAARGS